MTKQEYLTCPICAAQTKDYFVSTSGSLITDVKCTNRKCFFSSNYVPINVWDRYMHMVERCYSLEAENAALTLLHTQATDQMIKMQNRAHELEAENANLRADNRSLVEQMNQMVLKPNQEIIEWHQHPLYPDTSRCCIVECTDNCFYIAHHSDIDGWLHSITYEQLLNVKSWAYLPKGVINEHKTN